MENVSKTTVNVIAGIIALLTNFWSMLSENAELFNVEAEVIAKGTVVLAFLIMAYNTFKGTTESDE